LIGKQSLGLTNAERGYLEAKVSELTHALHTFEAAAAPDAVMGAGTNYFQIHYRAFGFGQSKRIL
jgi:hypothetical protein